MSTINAEDLIFYSDRSTNSYQYLIDLKSGKAHNLNTTYAGQLYNGSLSERNDGKGLIGVTNSNLLMSSDSIPYAVARTFEKEDFNL
jgi:hypothetical protein